MDNLKASWKRLDTTWKLILLTLTVSMLVALADNALSWLGWARRYIILDKLWLSGDLEVLARKPWTLLTYTFVHNSLWHLAVNMLLLGFAGKLFDSLLGRRRLLTVYLLGGVVAGLFYPILFFSLDMVGVNLLSLPLLGASGAIMAPLMAVICYAPSYSVELMGLRVPIILVSLLLLACFLIFVGTDNVGGLAAHAGGMAVGLAFGLLLRYRKIDITQPFLALGRTRKKGATMANAERAKAEKEKRMSELVTKIKQSGYAALSDEERRFIFDRSRRGAEPKHK